MNTKQVYQSPESKQQFFYGYILVIAALMIITLNYGARFSFGIFFKPMLNDFGWTRALTSGAFTASMLFQAMASPLLGRLNDKFGPRLVLTLCGFLLGLGYLLMSQVTGLWHLYLFYGAIIGIGMGGSFVASLSTVARWFIKRRGIMTGIVIAGLGIGTFIFSPLSNWLISTYDWRVSYTVTGSLVLVIGVLAAQVMRRDPSKMRLAPYGEIKGEKRGLPAGDQGFSFREAIHTRQFAMLVLIFFCLGYCLMALNVHLVPHITDLGISTTTAANVLAIMGALTAIGCIMLGGFADRLGSRQVCVISFFMVVVGLFLLVLAKEVWMFYLCAAVFGLGSGGSAPIESTVTAELFGMKAHGSIFGVISGCFTIGGALGPLLTGYLFDTTGNYQAALLACAGVGALGLIFSALLRPIKRRELTI